MSARWVSRTDTVNHKYDRLRNLIENSYFDINGIPVNNNKGFHKECFTYDEKGNLTSVMFYDDKNKLTNNLDYNAAIYESKYEYEENGIVKQVFCWYDKDHKLSTNSFLNCLNPSLDMYIS